jgi:hypothetical protein
MGVLCQSPLPVSHRDTGRRPARGERVAGHEQPEEMALQELANAIARAGILVAGHEGRGPLQEVAKPQAD